jgi:hypothetical protein
MMFSNSSFPIGSSNATKEAGHREAGRDFPSDRDGFEGASRSVAGECMRREGTLRLGDARANFAVGFLSAALTAAIAIALGPMGLAKEALAQGTPTLGGANACPPGAIPVGVTDSIQPIVDAAPEGASFCLQSGVHRMQTIRPKHRQKYFGENGAVLNGARLLDRFVRSGPYWVAEGPALRAPVHGLCLRSRPTCNFAEAVFVNDAPLNHVSRLDQMSGGTYFIDYPRRRIYLADDPAGKKVELAVNRVAIASNHARDVVVKNMIVEKYANTAQRGAIYGDLDRLATGWLIEGNEVRFNSGAGVLVGDRGVVRGNNVHHNGQLGIHPQGRDVLVEGNEIASNNIYGYDATWEAGGLKAAGVVGLTIRGNHVHHNQGPGLWCDIGCRNVVYESNSVEFNADAGIFHEISFDATIRNNQVRFNGLGGEQRGHQWFWAAEILVAASAKVEVYGNVIVAGPEGVAIALVDQGRRTPDGRDYYRTEHNHIHDNDIAFTDSSGKFGAVSDTSFVSPNFSIIEDGDNRFDRDTFRFPPSGPIATFAWGHKIYDFDGFRALGLEANSRTTTESADGAD